MIKKTITALLISSLVGCSSTQNLDKDSFDISTNKILKNEINKLQDSKKDYEEINIKPINEIEINKVPAKKIYFEFKSTATLKDLLDVFSYFKINTILDTKIDLETKVNINRFNGTLKDLTDAISEENNLSFEFKNNFLRIENLKQYTLKIINNKDVIEELSKQLKENKISEIIKTNNTISFKSNYKTYKKIKGIVNSINQNTSLINMNLVIIKVDLNNEINKGFDFTSLNIASNLNPENVIKSGFNLLNGNKIGIINNNINVSLVLNILNKYGNSNAIQNTNIKTISGKKATLKTVQKTPYLSDVQTTSNGDYLKTGYTTKEIETGLNIEILPFFDKDTKMINTTIKIKQSFLKEFLKVSNTDIEIQQPIIDEQLFESMIQTKIGESNVVGGLIYEEVKNNRNNFNFIENYSNFNSSKTNKKAIFIILKPSVKTYV